MIDLRSDTVTRPSKAMLEAMFSAKVGDDVFQDDPTVNTLEEKAAAMLGKEAAIFCPSGTMTNQIAVNLHTRPGDEVICHRNSHVYYYEGGAMMRISGVSVCLLDGERGQIDASGIAAHINPDDVHRPATALVEVENTMNKGGGSVYAYSNLAAIAKVCKANNLRFHLDGARLFNALAETGESALQYSALFDTVSICLSKGLGAPVGSLLLGDKTLVRRARRVRKVMGGGMRQAGYLAAAGIFALENNISRLKEDHTRARYLASVLEKMPYIEQVLPVESNILIFKLGQQFTETEFLSRLKEKDIHALSLGPQSIRFVTHLDFTDSMLMKVEEALYSLKP